MSHRCLALLGARAVVIAIVSLTPGPAAAQAAADSWTPSSTPWGDPDLQGIWSFATITPLERPSEFAGRELLTDAEVAELNAEAATRADRREGLSPERDVDLAYNQFWWDRGNSTGRTSLIVDPPDGRIPYTPEGWKRVEARRALRRRPAQGPEDRSPAERCIHHPKAGPPMDPGGYNNNFQLLQTPGYVAILNEQIHDARIIPLDGRPPIAQTIRQWMGDSRGRWEGDTLVVDTTNFNGKMHYEGSTENLHLVERFTRVGADTINYEFTVDDPTSFTRPWTAMIPVRTLQGQIYEFACHEGNYGMVGILSGARAEEKAAEQAAKQR